MSKHYLRTLFTPTSVAVFGASSAPDTFGGILFTNLLENDFKGKLYAINPRYEKIRDIPCYPTIHDVDEPIDLAIITTPANTVPEIIEVCGQHGVRNAVIISAGFSEAGAQGTRLEKQVVTNAKRYGLRFIGPGCLGIMNPSIGLNATLITGKVRTGNLALISQSGALCTAVLDWAADDLGFSTVLSLGGSADIDFGEVLDYLVSDPQTQGILMYIEGIHHTRSFMSGLRAAARIKPVILIKSGRHEIAHAAVKSHSTVLIGRDDVFDAALQRAGVVRVSTFGQLFSAAVTLASRYKAHGNRLGIVTNGGGPGVMAIDRAADLGIPLATLSPETLVALTKEMPPAWSRTNPIDILGDANNERYRKAVTLCLQDPQIDAVLVILTPQAFVNSWEVAQTLIEVADQSPKPLLACWMGGMQTRESRRLFSQARIPQFRTPEAAVEAFYYLSSYHQNQQLLLQTPAASPGSAEKPDVEGARTIIESVLAERRKVLTDMESKALLGAFRIPVVSTAIARSASESLVLAESMGFPVAMKINSPDILHKSDIGGVKLNIQSSTGIREAFKAIMQQVRIKRPDARIDGVTVERMSNKPNGRELSVGISRDAVFGPVITFGMGGTLVDVLGDSAVSLPPLNLYLVNTMIQKTRAAKLLGEFRHLPPAKRESLEDVLLRVSEIACELPWVQSLDINPLITDENGAIAVDARIVVDYYTTLPDRYNHMAIYPYPTHLVEQWQLPDGTDVIIRPIRPEDADMERDFVRNLSDETRYFRFMQTLHELTPTMLVRFTQIDYDREMALIAVIPEESQELEVGVARYAINPDGESCEFALVVADEWQHRGFAQKLMTCLMDAARTRGLKIIEGEVLSNNHNMLKLMKKLGFSAILDEEDRSITLVSKQL